MITENRPAKDLKFVNDLVYEKCGFRLTNFKLNSESVGYGACSFEVNGHMIEHRASKITPTKTGQFVTIWKRNKNGITVPFDVSDGIDFVAITSKRDNDIGQFIFPKAVLAEKGIISQNGKNGKRGIRVYPSWDTTTNKQAQKTQSWQTKYFFIIQKDNIDSLEWVKKTFATKCNSEVNLEQK